MSAGGQRGKADLEDAIIGPLVGQEPLTCRQALYLMASIGVVAKEAESHKLTAPSAGGSVLLRARGELDHKWHLSRLLVA